MMRRLLAVVAAALVSASSVAAQDAADHLARARGLHDEGRYAEAEAAFTRALEAAEEVVAAARARHGRGLARLRRAGPEGGRDLVEAAAVDLSAAAAALPPADAEPVLRLLVTAQRRLGDPSGAAAALARLAEVRATRLERLREPLAEARRLRDRQEFSAAIQAFDRVLELDPTWGEAFYDRGTCHLKLGRFIAGILDFSRAVELDPRISELTYQKLAQISHVVDLSKVLAELDRIVAGHPGVAHVLFLRGMFRLCRCELPGFDADDVALGLADMDGCLELNPEHVTALLYRGNLRLRAASLLDPTDVAGREAGHAAALSDFLLALEKDPESSLSHYLQGLCWAMRAGDAPDEAARSDRAARALEALRAARQAGFQAGDRLRLEPGFAALRQDPGFVELLRGR
ncbi:MAG: hypothetical protein KF878_30645 [Planctomycetes bacterium]|nr:hypothetical protein [Planctomycetota bacterium]